MSYRRVDFESDGPPSAQNDQDTLDFKEYGHAEHHIDIPLQDEAAGPAVPSKSSASPDVSGSMWSLAYYQRFFDVNTKQLAGRLLRTMFPFRGPFYSPGDDTPDLYGPFWICTSLIVLMAATGNVASFFNSKPGSFDFTHVTVAASCLYAVLTVVPLTVWFFLDRVGTHKGLVEVVSLYGYSLFPFIPTCIICIAPFELLRWVSVLTSFVLSVTFLLRNLLPSRDLPAGDRTQAYVLLGFMFTVHAGIALLMKLYFFSYN